ncbi:sulfotransferase domain-containing protein [Salinibacter ruber]|uniref:Sulfotransferase domain-containing protein n=1 Tax=Salinibacter ruber TaxID=146919 RepID=A0A9X2ZVD5_9BACT|nr:sulfotransferase domain-containing protein [Salinibacter ruber]MCS4122739.1 hypothetical protein [Salinibacter ruber]
MIFDTKIDHTIQVTSFGGAGTTMLYKFLDQCCRDIPKNTHDWIPWKHQQVPPADEDVKQGFRALYLFGNPMNTVLSIFRRGYQHWHFERMNESGEGQGLQNLEEFLKHDDDPFQLADHFERWTTAKRRYPIMLLRFETLWEQQEEVFAFLGVPSGLQDEFPKRRERHSDWRKQPVEHRKRLKRIYGSLAKRIQSRPKTEII